MIDIEERLRHDLKKRAERAQPESIRPLQIPPAARRSKARYWLASARRSRAARVLAPATAMVAVIAIIAGVWMAGHPAGNRSAAAGSTAGMPKYYVTLETVLKGKVPREAWVLAGVGPGSVTAVVRDSLTGARLDSVLIAHVPRGEDWSQSASWITAAANDRAFVIGVASHDYILRLRRDGQVEQLSRLPTAMSKISGGQPTVLSPAGTELAFTKPTERRLFLVTLATGATRSWQARPGYVRALQWQGTGNKIFISYGPQPQFRLLDVSEAGGNVLADSRPVFTWPPVMQNGWSLSDPLLEPDGKLLFSNHAVYTSRGVRITACRVVEYSPGARRLLRVLYSAHAPSSRVGYFPPCGVASVGPTGLNLLIGDIGHGRLHGTTFTRLPGWASKDFYPQAAW